MNSFVSSFNEKNGGHSCIPIIVMLLLGIDLLATISLIVFYDDSVKADNVFYLFTVGFLMCCTIYFSWHSLVKENAFEMTAFMSMAIIMTAEGIFFVISHSLPTLYLYLGIGFYVLTLFAYIICCYCCYMHYGNTAIDELEYSSHYNLLIAVKDYEIFISVVKLNFVLYTIVSSTFLYYVLQQWTNFFEIGLAMFIITYISFISYSIIGIYSVTKEKRKLLITYLILTPILQIIQGGMITEIYRAPAGHINFLLLDQAAVLFVISFLLSSGTIYLGLRNYKKFGCGAGSVLRQTNDCAIKGAFL